MAKSGTLNGELSFPIYYEDTDLSGFVYHANYLKFFERAREHLIGLSYLKKLWDDGIHFVVSDANLKYLKPARLGDEVTVRSEVIFSTSPVLRCKQTVLIKQDNEEAVLVIGEITLVTLNERHKPIRLPEHVIQEFLAH